MANKIERQSGNAIAFYDKNEAHLFFALDKRNQIRYGISNTPNAWIGHAFRYAVAQRTAGW
jgi:hypothetical protein